MSPMTTFAPSLANRMAMARPMPELPPVTIAVLPASRMCQSSVFETMVSAGTGYGAGNREQCGDHTDHERGPRAVRNHTPTTRTMPSRPMKSPGFLV